MINININIENKSRISKSSLNATDWLNSIKENKYLDKKGNKKKYLSATELLKKLCEYTYLNKLDNNKGHKPTDEYSKKGIFEVKAYDVKNEEGNIIKTSFTVYFTKKGRKKLLKLVLKLINEKKHKK